MTVDVNVNDADEIFLEDIEEIIEDTMVQIFLLRSSNEKELQSVQRKVKHHNSLFYYAPATCTELIDEKCKGLLVENSEEINLCKDKALYVEETDLTPQMIKSLVEHKSKGIILNATKTYPELKNFFICITPQNIESFQEGVIAKLPMSKIVLSCNYPTNNFDELFLLSKQISDKNFRPDQSIISEATKNALILFGFKKA
jgi:hypothetical protein